MARPAAILIVLLICSALPTVSVVGADSMPSIDPDDGQETWDFGDGSPTVEVKSDGNAHPHAKDGYAVTTHAYKQPGHYLVSVRRTNRRGETGTDRLHVRVAATEEGVPKVNVAR